MGSQYSNNAFDSIYERLRNLLPDQKVSNGTLFQLGNNTAITRDFSGYSLKRINIDEVVFSKCLFWQSAGAGAKFSHTTFESCDFSGSNFQYCQFNKVSFCRRSIIKGANFSHSVFINCVFEDVLIIESSFFDCRFEQCCFRDSIIKNVTLENSYYHSCEISNIDLSQMNLEYIQVGNTHLSNVVLPPYQIPYIIGAPREIFSASFSPQHVTVYTDNGNIPVDKYAHMYADLVEYFSGLHRFFPLANLLIASGRDQDAYKYIMIGVKEACDYFDFRMIKHYCKLACSNKCFTAPQLKALFDYVTSLSHNESWDISTLHFYMLNIGEIKELLLNNSENNERIEFVIKTNIAKDDLNAINELYNQINRTIKNQCSTTHVDSIELRHNSPYEIFITCIDSLSNILLLMSAMYSLFVAGNKALDFIKKIEDTIHSHKMNKLNLEEKELDIKIKKEQLQHEKATGKENNTSVVEIEHLIVCSSLEIAQEFNTEFLHNRFTNDSR